MTSLFTMGKTQIGFVWGLETLGFLACMAKILTLKIYYCKKNTRAIRNSQ